MIAMTARTTSGSSVEVLAVGTTVRYVQVDRYRAAERVRWGIVTAHHWQGDLFWHYVVDHADQVYPGSIVG